MPMTQVDIRDHYEVAWKDQASRARTIDDLAYSSPVEDAVIYPIYTQLLADHAREPDSKRVLDVGSGSGRWIGFFLKHYRPSRLLGIDYTQASVDLLQRWRKDRPEAEIAASVDFRQASITQPRLDLGETFDFINIANVLFHIPEPDLFMNALHNLRNHLAADGCVITTEYLPRVTMRTNWMLVRSRYDFEKACAEAGFRIAAIRASSFFSNDPMGLDGPDTAGRQHFNAVRQRAQTLMTHPDASVAKAATELMIDIERATLTFAKERVAELDLPSQKLVMLVPG